MLKALNLEARSIVVTIAILSILEITVPLCAKIV
jgi:hypothetical protein